MFILVDFFLVINFTSCKSRFDAWKHVYTKAVLWEFVNKLHLSSSCMRFLESYFVQTFACVNVFRKNCFASFFILVFLFLIQLNFDFDLSLSHLISLVSFTLFYTYEYVYYYLSVCLCQVFFFDLWVWLSLWYLSLLFSASFFLLHCRFQLLILKVRES